jgi:hypothetical protein
MLLKPLKNSERLTTLITEAALGFSKKWATKGANKKIIKKRNNPLTIEIVQAASRCSPRSPFLWISASLRPILVKPCNTPSVIKAIPINPKSDGARRRAKMIELIIPVN